MCSWLSSGNLDKLRYRRMCCAFWSHIQCHTSNSGDSEGVAYSWSRHDITIYLTITIKPKILHILRHAIWEINSVFIVDLNATIRRGFTNLTADYQKLLHEIGEGIDGKCITGQIEIPETLISLGHGLKKIGFFIGNAGKSQEQSPYIYITLSNPRMTNFENL